MQWSAYVLKEGETDAPQGLKNALARANRVAEIFMAEFRAAAAGNEIVDEAMRKATAEGLRPLIYTHPLGVYGHAAGPPMDARAVENAPENSRARRLPALPEHGLRHRVQRDDGVPEWGSEDVRIGYEEDAVFTAAGCRFIDGRQTRCC